MPVTLSSPDIQPIDPVEFSANWGLAAIGADKALQRGLTGAGVRVGVVDGSMQLSHPEFSGRADVFQFDDVDDGNHGTHVGGIIGAAQDGTGMQGVAPGVLLSSIRVFRASNGYHLGNQQTADGYDAAIAAGIRLFNNSWGSITDIRELPGVSDVRSEVGTAALEAYRRAVSADAVLVWSAGNNHFPDPLPQPALPYFFPELESNWVAVASVNQALELSSFSNACGVAARWCISAPGSDIYSTWTTDAYYTESGTSMAAPHVTGSLAIAKQMFPNASGSELTRIAFQTATDLGAPGIDEIYGWGLLNLGNIVDMIEPETASFFANAAWSRFSTLQHVAAAIPQDDTGSAVFAGDQAAAFTSFWPLEGKGDGIALAGEDDGPHPRVWVGALYGASHLGAAPDNPGAESETTAALLGVDLIATDTERFGIAAGYSRTDLTSDVPGDDADEDGYHLLAYGHWKSDGWFAAGVGQAAYFDQSITRSNISGAQGTSLTPVGASSPATWAGELDGRFGREWISNGYEVAPYVAAAIRWQDTAVFEETGAGIFSLSVQSSNFGQFEIGPGVRFRSPEIQFESLVARASFDAGYSYLAGDRDYLTYAKLLGTSIEGTTAEVGEHILRIGADLKVTGNDGNTSGIIAYSGLFQENATTQTVSASLRQAF
ncbi:S8 family serine peptidase [Mesorhizobium sp. VNQ89]|uniref:S8 family peptidase n=1 Tax=Mesorhizobium quangtriensis TaxID=3157709 RepID=UPI0032B7AF56